MGVSDVLLEDAPEVRRVLGVRELSRMLAGLENSDTALAHAQELLQTAQESRTPTR